MWPFFLTHTHEAVRKLRAPPKAVLSLLHGDPEHFFRLSPFVASVAKNADPHSYTIVEEIPVLGRTTQTTFTVIVRLVEDGVENDVVADLGTRSTNTYHVRKTSEDGVCELVHHTTTRGLFLFMWYIVRTQMNAHELFRDKLQLALEGESFRSLESEVRPPNATAAGTGDGTGQDGEADGDRGQGVDNKGV